MYVRQLCDEFFLEEESFPKDFVDKMKKDILFLNISLLKIFSFMRECGKNVVDRDTEHDFIIQHTRFACC